jgi:hypothetical protein
MTVTRWMVTHIQESWQFELMYTLKGKSDTHDTCTSGAGPRTPHIRFSWTVPICGNLTRQPNRVGRTLLLPRKRPPDTILNTSGDWSACLSPSFSPNKIIEAVMKAKHLLRTGYIGLLSPYLQHVISTFNTFSWGPTHRSLTDTGGGYNLGGAGFSHHPSRPF